MNNHSKENQCVLNYLSPKEQDRGKENDDGWEKGRPEKREVERGDGEVMPQMVYG